jgi:adenine specific DNA methylase Mod
VAKRGQEARPRPAARKSADGASGNGRRRAPAPATPVARGLNVNALYYGDNLQILREYIPDESVDLVYLDPPFNSNRSYNVLFKDSGTKASPAQIEAFEDTWHWGPSAQSAFEEIALHGTDDTARLLKAIVDALGRNDVTAYLSMMAVRLIELRRVLKPTGTIWLHCDPTAGHYLKVLMDSIFDPRRFINQISWKRSTAHSDSAQGSRHFGRVTDRSRPVKWCKSLTSSSL